MASATAHASTNGKRLRQPFFVPPKSRALRRQLSERDDCSLDFRRPRAAVIQAK
jgi:hypothetical protein